VGATGASVKECHSFNRELHTGYSFITYTLALWCRAPLGTTSPVSARHIEMNNVSNQKQSTASEQISIFFEKSHHSISSKDSIVRTAFHVYEAYCGSEQGYVPIEQQQQFLN